jgi:RHS repeat-associated protein
MHKEGRSARSYAGLGQVAVLLIAAVHAASWAGPSRSTTTTLQFAKPTLRNGEVQTWIGTVSPTAAPGVVVFCQPNTQQCVEAFQQQGTLANGVATYSARVSGAGLNGAGYTWCDQARYFGGTVGNTTYLPSQSSPSCYTVLPQDTTTAMTASQSYSSLGQTVTLSATVNCHYCSTSGWYPNETPTTVTFYANGVPLATVARTTVPGDPDRLLFSLTTTIGALGSYQLYARFNGGNNGYASQSGVTAHAVVTGVPEATVASIGTATSVEVGRATTVTATVTGTNSPDGTVTFKAGGQSIGTAPLVGQQATLSTSFASVGDRQISVEYGGNAYNLPSTSSPATVSVVKRTASLGLLATPQPVEQNGQLTLTANVSGYQPTGTITFTDGGAVLGQRPVTQGAATFSLAYTGAIGSHSIQASYDGDQNNVAATSAPLGLQVIDGTPTMRWRLEYDADGALTKVVDPLSRATAYAYNDLKQTVRTDLPLPGASITFGNDLQGNLKLLQDPRNVTTTQDFTGLGEYKTSVSPDAGSKSVVRDASGNITSLTDGRGKTATMTYDAANRLKSVTYATGTPITLEYDGGTTPVAPNIGKLTKITDESGSTSYGYNARGQIVTKTQVTNGKTLANAYAYGTAGGANGQVTSFTLPGKSKINYGYDTQGRLTSMTLNPIASNGSGPNTAVTVPLVSSVTYSPTGKVTGWVWGDGTPYVLTYDEFDRLISMPIGKPTGTGQAAGSLRALTPDDAGRVIAMTHTNGGVAQPALDHTFAYDEMGRLSSATINGSATTYGYGLDAGSNRVTRTIGGTAYAQTVSATSNRQMQSVDGTGSRTIQYDNGGNVINDGIATYTYSDRGRLASATIGSNVVTYKYNGVEQRVQKSGPSAVVSTGTHYFAYGEEGQLVGEYDANLVPIFETVYFGSTPVAVVKYTKTGTKTVTWSTSYSFVYSDHLATPRVIVRNTDHAIQWRWDTAEPFGATVPSENPSGLGVFPFNQRFPGQQYESETGNFYNWHRDYRPQLGRYLQSDPIGLHGGANTYAYVGGNPIGLIDLTGEIGLPGIFVGGAIGAISGAFGAAANGTSIFTGAVIGGLAGAAVGFTGGLLSPGFVGSVSGAVAWNAGVRAAAGALGNIAGQGINGLDPCRPGFNVGGILGAAAGGALGGVLAPGAWGTAFVASSRPFAARGTLSFWGESTQRAIAGLPGAATTGSLNLVGTKMGAPDASDDCECQR